MLANTPSTAISGIHVFRDPEINGSTAFTEAERDALGITGLLPAGVERPKDLEAFLASKLYKAERPNFMAAAARAGGAA